MQALDTLKSELLAKIDEADTPESLDAIRVDALGKKGVISEQLKSLGSLPAEERKSFGQLINQVKEEVNNAISAKAKALADAALTAKLENEAVDVDIASSLSVRRALPSFNAHNRGNHSYLC